MKNLIKSRRGIAIEMAIGAMFIMMALSIVLISISGMQTRHMKNDHNDFHEKIEVYEVADYIVNNHKPNQPVTEIENKTKFKVVANGGNNDYVYTISKDEEVILTLEIRTTESGEGDQKITTNTITSWRD